MGLGKPNSNCRGYTTTVISANEIWTTRLHKNIQHRWHCWNHEKPSQAKQYQHEKRYGWTYHKLNWYDWNLPFSSFSSAGSFTCIKAELTFGRLMGYFIFNTYIPSFVIVAMTWLAFWILPSPSVTRFTLISICLLSAIGLMETAKRITPQVRQVWNQPKYRSTVWYQDLGIKCCCSFLWRTNWTTFCQLLHEQEYLV